MQGNVRLSKQDCLLLHSYKKVIDGLAAYLGSSYEIVLHSLGDLDHSVIKIVNGFHTGRKEGAPITDLALDMWNKLQSGKYESDHLVYFSKNKLGEPMKSTTIAIRGGDQIIGLLCINLYLGTPLIHFLDDLTPHDAGIFAAENFADNSPATIEQELKAAKDIVWNDATVSNSLRNKEVIRILQKRGVFEIKNSVELVANELKISINTVYFHLRNLAKKEDTPYGS